MANSSKNSNGRSERMSRGMRAWSRRHSYSLFSSLGTLYRNPLGTLLTVMVLGIALALPLGLFVSVKNIAAMDSLSAELGAVSVFLEPGASGAVAQATQQRLVLWSEVSTVTIISPADALEEFSRQSGFGNAVNALDGNPLPYVLELTLAEAFSDSGSGEISALIERLHELQPVDFAEYDLKWLERLQAMMKLASSVVQVLTAVFGLAVIFVVGNTIRLDIQNRIEEIEVMSLVGATDSFVRRPFLYAGLWYGLLGGVLALLVLLLALFYLKSPLEQLLSAYQGSFHVQSLSIKGMAYVLAGSGLLGLLGASLAVRRHLRALTPKIR